MLFFMSDRIFFWLDTEFLYFCLSYHLQKYSNADLFAIIDVPSNTKKFFVNQNLVKFNQSWYLHDHIKPSSIIDYEYLQNFEKKYKIDLWQVALNERIFYKYNKFYKFTSNEILSILENECKLFEKILDDIKPTHFITKQTIQHKDYLFFEICKKRNIKTIVTYIPKSGYGCMISENLHKMDNLHEYDHIKGNQRGFLDFQNYMSNHNPTNQIKKYSKIFLNSKSKLSSAAIQFLLYSNNSSSKENFTHYGHSKIKTIIDRLTFSYQKKIRFNFLNKTLEKSIKDEPFIYYPLPVDLERENLIATPYYTNTLEVIRNIAKSIPIEFKLYVKEHPGQKIRNWRSIEEYKKIMEIPNVVLLHPSVSTVDLYKKCSLVVSLGGSPGFEAAIYQKPSVIFADLDYTILPSVTKIDSIEDLHSAIVDSLKKPVLADDIDRYLTLVEKNLIDFDIHGFTIDEFEYFFYGGNMEDVDIQVSKMEDFLELKKPELTILSNEIIKKL